MHPVPLAEVLRRARLLAFEPSRSVADGSEWKTLSSSELKSQAETIVKRAEGYARWRVEKYESGDCAHTW